MRDRMREIHVGKRGSEAAGEEESDEWRKTVRFEQESLSSSAAASSYTTATLEYPASGETQSRQGSVFVQTSGHLMTTYKFPRGMHSTRWMDERVVTSEKLWSGIEEKMPEISREVN